MEVHSFTRTDGMSYYFTGLHVLMPSKSMFTLQARIIFSQAGWCIVKINYTLYKLFKEVAF